MSYNLIEAPWIPVLGQGGGTRFIAPWQITEKESPVKIAAPRADFNGALTEFLIGLLQTCMAPSTEREWRKLYQCPPTPDALHDAFSNYSDAFVLDGEGPRFMQDLNLTPKEAGKPNSIASILIDSPGNNTIQQNKDLFVKRERVERLCPACAAAALFTMQCFAPSGGSGHRTSVRGGGPLTTLVLGDTLWETVWTNVLTEDALQALGGDFSKSRNGGIFPWLAPTRTSEKGEKTHLAEVHPLHKYWSMPRRIRLILNEETPCVCGLCNRKTDLSTSCYLTRPRGYNYAGSWMHPLSPIRDNGDEYLAVKGSSDGLGYQNWLGLVYRQVEERKPVQAAPVVSNYREKRVMPGTNRDADFRIWAFGFDMDNMKARAWCEGIMPAWAVADEPIAERLAEETSRLIRCSEQGVYILRQALREAFFSKYVNVKNQASFMESVSAKFWSDTRGPFFITLAILVEKIKESRDPPIEVRRSWLSSVVATVRPIYSHLADAESLVTNDPRRYASGWNILRSRLSVKNKYINKILDLPIDIDEFSQAPTRR